MGWNWSWTNPWRHAILHVDAMKYDLTHLKLSDKERAGYYERKLNGILKRYNDGERTMKLFSAMYSIKKKDIQEVTK